MATDLRTARNGKAPHRNGATHGGSGASALRGRNGTAPKRDNGGRFASGGRGGPGRPKGKPNQTTIDLRAIRDRIAASWNRVDGDAMLDQLARDDPREYLRLVVSILPKHSVVTPMHTDPLFVGCDLDRV